MVYVVQESKYTCSSDPFADRDAYVMWNFKRLRCGTN